MKAEYWQSKWQEGKVGFHQTRINSRLQQHWQQLGLTSDQPVLVPLCGKSLDMMELHSLGHPVVGSELSDIALRAFFNENGLTFNENQQDNLHEFTGTGQAAGIRLLAGDIFDLKPASTGPLGGFYDRAALIALPPEMRQAYADKLASLLPIGAVGLLISLVYDPSKMKGPPFSVPDDEVHRLFTGQFEVEELAYSSGAERLGNLAQRGLDTMEEHVYRLQRI